MRFDLNEYTWRERAANESFRFFCTFKEKERKIIPVYYPYELYDFCVDYQDIEDDFLKLQGHPEVWHKCLLFTS